jgi:hypothetical protein
VRIARRLDRRHDREQGEHPPFGEAVFESDAGVEKAKGGVRNPNLFSPQKGSKSTLFLVKET